MDLIVGLGEVGFPWFNLVSKVREATGIDINPLRCRGEWRGEPIDILHICIPYSIDFVDLVVGYAFKYNPQMLVIHSTVKPFTTRNIDRDGRLQSNLQVLYSPVRGIHTSMESDLIRYDKFFASYRDECSLYEHLLGDMAIKGCKMKNPHTLEFAKILCDTTYFGYLIAYAMKTDEIAMKYGVDYDEMWTFADQIHEHLGNRPPCGSLTSNKLYADPKGISGHCILPNLELMKDDLSEVYSLIHKINKACIRRYDKKGSE